MSEDNTAVQEQAKTTLSPLDAVKEVIKLASHNESLARGLYEAVKALDRGAAQLCVLSGQINEPAYKKLITALCKEHNIKLVEVPNNKLIGEAAGLVRRKTDGTIAKSIGCSCVVIKQWGTDSDARAAVLSYLANGVQFK